MSSKRSEARPHFITESAVFAACIFSYMSANTLENQLFAPIGGNDVQLRMYYIQQAAVLAGLLVYVLLCDYIPILKKTAFKAALAGIFSAGLAFLFFFREPAVFYIAEPLCAFIIGYMAGTVYEYLALSFASDPERLKNLSHAVGFGGAAAVLLQWLFQFALSIGFALPVMVMAGLCFIIYTEGKTSVYDSPRQAGENEDSEPMGRSILLFGIIVSAVLIMLVLYEVHMNNLEFATYFLDWPRLFIAVGYLAIALAGSFGRKDALSLVMLCMALPAVLFPMLMQDIGEFHLHMSIYYIILGTAISYYTVMYANMGAASTKPALVSSMGRIIDMVITIGFGLLNVTAMLSELQAAATEVVLFALAIVMMKAGGYLARGEESERYVNRTDTDTNTGNTGETVRDTDVSGQEQFEPETAATSQEQDSTPEAGLSAEDHIAAFAEAHGFTPRENDVYRLLVTTDLKNQEMADSLYISRRALQNHIKNIYEKSSVTNRAGLIVAVQQSVQNS